MSNKISSEQLPLRKHLETAVEWLLRAHIECSDGGISKGFDLLRNRWAPSYPETTGYTIPTLLNTSFRLGCPDLKDLALSLADYLLGVITPEGGVAHWDPNSESLPIVFDTGQVVFGWLAAYDASGGQQYLQAATRAGDWLASVQNPSGCWVEYQHLGVAKVIDTRVSWALLELHQRTNQNRYLEAAVRNLDWAINQQSETGWFDHCAFVSGQDPITHTLAYTAEGLFQCGCILNETRYIGSAKRLANMLLSRQRRNGSLARSFRPDWSESSYSSCLTGNCQMAHLWLNLFQMDQEEKYYDAAKDSILFVARTQKINSKNSNIRGAIAGSHPIFGRYERFKYPNWAAKFFIDALLALEEPDSKNHQPYYVG